MSCTSSGLSTWVNHSARLAARRRPRSSSGSLSWGNKACDLLAGGDMAERRAGAKRRLVDVVECGQPAWKELAKDHALGKTVDGAKAELEGQFLQPVSDELLVARSEHRQSVAHHDPVGGRAVELAALAAGVPHHLGIMADAGHRIGCRIDLTQHVEIQEAVVDRSDQSV